MFGDGDDDSRMILSGVGMRYEVRFDIDREAQGSSFGFAKLRI